MEAKIPYEFIRSRADISWNDVLFALERQLISPSVAVQRARDALTQTENPQPDVDSLAWSSYDEPLLDRVQQLALLETGRDDGLTQEKWLYLVLAWLYEIKDSIRDPLGVVEDVYCDFDHPSSVTSFIRYMPMAGPLLGSRQEYEARMLGYWRDYLDKCARRFGPTRADGNEPFPAKAGTTNVPSG